MRSKIDLIAMKARTWIETNLDKKNFNKDFCGACAWAATYILYRLQQEEIESYVAISTIPGGEHAFVVTKDYIVDVTATQFKHSVDKYLPEVIVVSRKKKREYFWEDVKARLRTPEAVVDYTLDPKWPMGQIPNLKFIEDTYENF